MNDGHFKLWTCASYYFPFRDRRWKFETCRVARTKHIKDDFKKSDVKN